MVKILRLFFYPAVLLQEVPVSVQSALLGASMSFTGVFRELLWSSGVIAGNHSIMGTCLCRILLLSLVIMFIIMITRPVLSSPDYSFRRWEGDGEQFTENRG